ncbi:DUF559 domain-containing protein [Calothrix membranacea FACHB-236]|nr:DUF559 domain-containing protein [Calothrix membranacea FACHB-236]
MVFQGVEHKVKGGSIVSIGGKLPYYLEVQTSKLLDLLVILSRQNNSQEKTLRDKINRYLYSKTTPGFYLEFNEHLHLAYADQRNGHGTQHWWRLFFDSHYKQKVEEITRGTSLAVPGKDVPHSSDADPGHEYVGTHSHPQWEWGGMYFRSKAEIKVAEELDKYEVLFFANSRGRIGKQGSPVSDASGWLTGRVETDFLVFYKRKCMILEVDGQHHQESLQITRDYVRDRVFLREGIATVRFAAKECFEQTADVIVEFLNMF